jgi:hypothetical protein
MKMLTETLLIIKVKGWEAKLATSLLVTASSLGSNPDIPQKS